MPEADSRFDVEYIARLLSDRWLIQGRPLGELQIGDYVGIEVTDEAGDLDIVILEALVVVPSSYILPELTRKVEGILAVIARMIDPSDGKYVQQLLAAKHLVAGPEVDKD